METVTLSGDDFRTLHNTLCDLRNLVQRMESSMIKTNEFHRIIEGLEMGLKNAYEQDEDVFDRKMDYYREHQENCGYGTIWSVYDVSDNCGFFELHPWQGANVLVYNGTTVKIPGPTWGDLYRAADEVMDRTDTHHMFIEGFDRYGLDNSMLQLSTGS